MRGVASTTCWIVVSLAVASSCEWLRSPEEVQRANLASSWKYAATTRDRMTPTYCTISGIVEIQQYGSRIEGRLTGLASCQASGFAFGEALNDRIVDGLVEGKSVRFNVLPTNCPHIGGVMQDDKNTIRGSYGPECAHTGDFVMTRR
jgi:hypothetical protein